MIREALAIKQHTPLDKNQNSKYLLNRSVGPSQLFNALGSSLHQTIPQLKTLII